MIFSTEKPIYIQIEEMIQNNILNNVWKKDERILSVRQLALEIETNPNTVQRSYSNLENEKIIYNKRGIGYFVSEQAINIIKKKRIDNFLNTKLKTIAQEIKYLAIDVDSFIEKLKKEIDKIENK